MAQKKTTSGKFHIEFLTPVQKLAWGMFQQHDVLFLIGPAGCGKAQPLNSIVYTSNGPKEMGKTVIGEEVCTPDGEYAKIIAIYPQGMKDVYRITFKNGDVVEACGEHLWKISSDSSRGWSNKVVNTLYIKENIKTPKGRKNFSINCPLPVQFEERDVPIDPYILGVLLGDGGFTGGSVVLTSADEEIINEVGKLLKCGYFIKKQSSEYGYIITTDNKELNVYKRSLKDLGLWGHCSWEKFIPDLYLYNSVEVRTALLQGLMDTDGTVSKTGYCYLCTTSEVMANQFKILVQSLGGICKIISKTKKFKYKGKTKIGKLAYHCSVNFNDFTVFRLNRKKYRCRKKKKYFVKRIIDSVEYVGQKECQCIVINNPEHLYLTDNFIATHNSYLSMAFAVYEILQNQKKTKKIILTRPIVEAGENLGFLPGDLNEKVDPYMMPLFDCVHKLVQDTAQKMAIEQAIEVAPIAYLRGRTFDNAVCIFDEAQNATMSQLKLFLTRFGQNSKIIVTGDPSQTDIGAASGLAECVARLETIPGIGTIRFPKDSIVRHPLVSAILDRLEE